MNITKMQREEALVNAIKDFEEENKTIKETIKNYRKNRIAMAIFRENKKEIAKLKKKLKKVM